MQGKIGDTVYIHTIVRIYYSKYSLFIDWGIFIIWERLFIENLYSIYEHFNSPETRVTIIFIQTDGVLYKFHFHIYIHILW